MTGSLPPRRGDVVADTIRRFLRRGARSNLIKLLGKTRPADVALLLPSLTPAEQREIFGILVAEYPESAGEVLTELEPPQRAEIVRELGPQETAHVLDHLSVDDAVYLLESLPEDLHEQVLEHVDLREMAEVQTHLSYPEDSAGRIMDTGFFALPETTKVREAIAAIQDARDVEMIFYLYVVDADGHLVGVTSLRQLLLASRGEDGGERTLGEIMTRSVVKVHTDTDQEEVARLAARYDLLAIPVTDSANHLVGIITVDDVIDILKEEATEDILKMAGTSGEELLYEARSWKVARIRLPWLVVNLVGGVITGILLERFQVSLREQLFLLTFVPLIMGMGGNVASQTAIIAVRGLATGHLGEGRIRRFLWHQVKVGAAIGLTCSLLVAGGALILNREVLYAAVVGPALYIAILVASFNGAVVPVLFERLGIDPAVASGPLVTTSNDISGILIYFGLAALLIGRLAP